MIVKAAVKIFDIKQNKEIILPAHRHVDIYEILYNLGYKKDVDYHLIKEGFLDENDVFLDRHAAWLDAVYSHQIVSNNNYKELFSEDIY